MSRQWVWLATLGALVLTSAVAVVTVKHQSRGLFVELETLRDERDALNTEWSRLRLEQGALATNARVERLAREALGLRQPDATTLVLLEPDSTAGERP